MTMRQYDFRLVNVFAESPLAGNPLCVFEDARDLDDAAMQALALQFNLSETTFVLPSASATAKVRIFTPTFEMPFAGHPTLGTAHVVRDLLSTGDALTLEMKAGVIPVAATGDVWTLQANAPVHRGPTATREELASMLGLAAADLDVAPSLWVDTGSEQLIVPLISVDAVRRVDPDAGSIADWPRSSIAEGRASGKRSDSVSMRAATRSTSSPLFRPTYSEPSSSSVSRWRGSSTARVAA